MVDAQLQIVQSPIFRTYLSSIREIFSSFNFFTFLFNKPEQIDSVPAGSVLFISAPPDIINAVYGGLMSIRAKYCRAVGTVVDGRIRDLQEHRESGYAVSMLSLLN